MGEATPGFSWGNGSPEMWFPNGKKIGFTTASRMEQLMELTLEDLREAYADGYEDGYKDGYDKAVNVEDNG